MGGGGICITPFAANTGISNAPLPPLYTTVGNNEDKLNNRKIAEKKFTKREEKKRRTQTDKKRRGKNKF